MKIKKEMLKSDLVVQKVHSEIEYKIQLGIFLESMKNSSIFNGIDVEEFQSNGTYKYLVHHHQIRNTPDQLKVKYRSGKFPGGIYNSISQRKTNKCKRSCQIYAKQIKL